MSGPAGSPSARIDFGCVAEDYDATRSVPTAFMQEIVEDIIATAHLDRHALMLEVGCGTGRFICELAKRGLCIVGIDISYRMLNVAIRSLQEVSSSEPALVIADAVSPPIPNGIFDVVLGVHVFHLLSDWREAVQAAKRGLNPSGVIIFGAVTSPFHKSQLYALYDRRRAELNYPAPVYGGTTDEVSTYLRGMGARIECHEFLAETDISVRETLDCLQRRLFSGMWHNMPAVIHRKLMAEIRKYASSQFSNSDAKEHIQLTASIQYAHFD